MNNGYKKGNAVEWLTGLKDKFVNTEFEEYLHIAIGSIKALEEIRQEAVDAIEDGLYVRNTRILDIIDKHMKEVEA